MTEILNGQFRPVSIHQVSPMQKHALSVWSAEMHNCDRQMPHRIDSKRAADPPRWGNRSASSWCFWAHSFTSLCSRLIQDKCGEKALAFMRIRSVLGASEMGARLDGRRVRGLLLEACLVCAIECVVGATPCIGRLVFWGWGDLQTEPCGGAGGFTEVERGDKWACCCGGAGGVLKCSCRTFKISVSLWRCRFWANLLCNFFFTVAPFFRSSSSSLKAKGSSNSVSR